MSRDFTKWFRDVAKTPGERRYCDRAELVHKERLARRTFALAAAFHLASFGIDPFVAEPSSQAILIIGHVVMIAAYVAFRLTERFVRPQSGRWWSYGLTYVHFATYLVTARHAALEIDMLVPKSAGVVVAFLMLEMVVSPLQMLGTAVMAIAHGIGGVWLARGFDQSGAVIATIVICVTMMVAVRAIRIRLVRLAALAEFRNKLMMAPAHVVERVAFQESSIEEAFRPARRTSVSVCVGWRNYGELARELPSDALAAILKAYYQCCDDAIDAVAVAHYADAVADELFVVFFDDETGSEEKVLRAAFLFARATLEAAKRSPALLRVATEIDVGIAGGEILLGLMGPIEHRKTTGLGEAPGRAARLKSAAGQVRSTLGDASRICLDSRAAAHLATAEARSLHSFALGRGEEFRDLGTNAVYFWTVA